MSNERYWDERVVMSYLQDAAGIHRRLPPVSVPTYHTLWPETKEMDDWKRLYNMVNGRTTLGSPYPSEVSYSEAVMEWLTWIERDCQQIIWMRANKIPWLFIVEEKERSKQTLWRDMKHGLCQIATMLNTQDPEGEHHSHLRLRANGVYQHHGTN